MSTGCRYDGRKKKHHYSPAPTANVKKKKKKGIIEEANGLRAMGLGVEFK